MSHDKRTSKGSDASTEPTEAGDTARDSSGDSARDSFGDYSGDYERLSRRKALVHLGAVGAASAAAAYVGLAPSSWPGALSDPSGELGKPVDTIYRLPAGGFATDKSAAKKQAADLGVARGTNAAAMVKSAIDSIGGIHRFISPGDVVVVKPNVAFGRAAALGATTNPDVLDALIRTVKEAGASEVRVADNPIESPQDCFIRSGIRKASLAAGARVFLPSPSAFETLAVDGAKWIERWPFFWQPFRGANKVIGVSPVKDHNLCQASMTTKNWYGLLGGRRNQFHQDIHGIITDLTLMMKPTFVVLDGTRVMWRSGPTGGSLDDVRPGNTIVAGTDSLAVDSWGWDHLLERRGLEKPLYLSMSEARGFGTTDYHALEIREEQIG